MHQHRGKRQTLNRERDGGRDSYINMAAFRKFKHLATNCATRTSSPTRSAPTSPAYNIRRYSHPVTLRKLLISSDDKKIHPRRKLRKRWEIIHRPPNNGDSKRLPGHTLKDLFRSSTAFISDEEDRDAGIKRNGVLPTVRAGDGVGKNDSGSRLARPTWTRFRYRFSKRSWRPTLVAIPE